MITSIIDEQFLYWENNKTILYPGCKETDTRLLLVLRNEIKLELLFSFSWEKGEEIELHKIDLNKVHPLDIEYLIESALPPHNTFSKECLNHIYSQGRISEDFYDENLTKTL